MELSFWQKWQNGRANLQGGFADYAGNTDLLLALRHARHDAGVGGVHELCMQPPLGGPVGALPIDNAKLESPFSHDLLPNSFSPKALRQIFCL